MSGCDVGSHRRAPLLGEHTGEILSQIGIGSSELADLRARGVVR
jgi:crotonobetainyl-CoA:carnitine CoA-transferase CaiB-like acyl-CoA transferase